MNGFSLVELLVTITIIAIMSAMSVALFQTYKDRAHLAEAASDLKNFETAFNAYLIDNQSYPDDTHIVLPAGMSDFIPASNWGATPLGGTYNWEGPDNYPYAGIAFFEPTASTELFVALDNMLDDGNTSTGKFRTGTGGRYTYTID